MKKITFGMIFVAVLFALFSFEVSASVTGIVVDRSGVEIAGVTVIFTDDTNTEKKFSAVTGGNGKYEINIFSIRVENTMPVPFSLQQNYPNPFNPSTIIPFSINKAGYVELSVYTITGQRMKTLVSGHLSAGPHTAVWRGDDDAGNTGAAGVYLYQLVSEGRRATGKMLMVDGGSGSFISTGSMIASHEPGYPSALKPAGSAYTVTITGDAIEPFEKRGMEITDRGVYDFVVEHKAIRVPADFHTIAEAIDAAPEGGTVSVSAGTYTENIVIGKSLTLRGEGMGVTVIKGQDIPGGPAVRISDNNVTITGFTITGGFPGVAVDGESAVLEGNTIVRNRDLQNGLGILVNKDSCTIRNNLIVHNGETFDGEGAGIKAFSVQSLVIENNTICDNSGANGAYVGNGYGVYVKDSQGTIINNIIADNDAWDGPNGSVKGYGIYLDGASQVRGDYNDVWDNDDDANLRDENAVKTITNYYGMSPGEHDISRNPLFIDRGKYELLPKSPCIDAGAPEYDYSLEPKPNGGRINMGAYGNTIGAEQSVLFADAGGDRTEFTGMTVTLDGSGSWNPGGGPLSYTWSVISKPQGSEAALSGVSTVNPSFIPDVTGTYAIRLVVSDGAVSSDPDTVAVLVGFTADFNDGSAKNWKPVSGSWTVQNGMYMVSSSGYKTSSSYYDASYGNFELEVKIRKTVGASDNVGVFFRGNPTQINSNRNWNNGYALVCGSGDWNITKYENGYDTSVRSWTHSNQLTTGIGQWIVLKIRCVANQIEVSINGVTQGAVYDSTFSSGFAGIKMYDDSISGKAEIDYIILTPLTGN